MNRAIFCFFVFSISNLFSQKNIVNLDSIIKSDNYKVYKNINYGNHERNVLDLWIAESEIKSPLMIYIHGGGLDLVVKNLLTGKIILIEIKNLMKMEYRLRQLIIDLKTMKTVFFHA